jgi:hypothetical protein
MHLGLGRDVGSDASSLLLLLFAVEGLRSEQGVY